VAADIVATIVSRRLQPGDALPPERELGEQFGVSRTVIREAVRALDARGLLDVRVGSRIRVATVDPTTVRDAIWHFVRTSRVEETEVVALRDALDAIAAHFAAERATERDLELIERAVADTDGGAREGSDRAFRRAILAATRNELLIVLADALANLPAAGRRADNREGTARAVADAIARGDAAAAERAMWQGARQPR
jgi:GntR family transcriptional regulator, transcriptional repressor for pyruvate dehydrogenase complex